MNLFIAPQKDSGIYTKSLFLAGGITNCPDWQSFVIEKFKNTNLTIYNPRRPNFQISDANNKEQIDWEFKYLRWCDSIMFWFPAESICPIALFELGGALERLDLQQVFVGCSPDYPRRKDLEIQLSLIPNGPVLDYNLENLVKHIKYTLDL